MSTHNKPLIGFIGQGWIGGNYALDFEERGYKIVRYSRRRYARNKSKIKNCDIVFIAVPTPTTPQGFDDTALTEVIALVGDGKIAVIKSTVKPGTTEKLQKKYPRKIVLHAPEFLTEATARYDAKYPKRNIIGYVNNRGRQAANRVMCILPEAPYKGVVPARVAELVKYGGNCWFYFKVVYINLLHDLAEKLGVDYELVKEGMSYDTRIGFTHLDPVHKSGRGAGGHCFIKDFAVFKDIYAELCGDDDWGIKLLETMEKKNVRLLKDSKKDLDLLRGVYGE